MWLATNGQPEAVTRGLQHRWDAMLDRLFATAAEEAWVAIAVDVVADAERAPAHAAPGGSKWPAAP